MLMYNMALHLSSFATQKKINYGNPNYHMHIENYEHEWWKVRPKSKSKYKT
jgi:hypothetical protein